MCSSLRVKPLKIFNNLKKNLPKRKQKHHQAPWEDDSTPLFLLDDFKKRSYVLIKRESLFAVTLCSDTTFFSKLFPSPYDTCLYNYQYTKRHLTVHSPLTGIRAVDCSALKKNRKQVFYVKTHKTDGSTFTKCFLFTGEKQLSSNRHPLVVNLKTKLYFNFV